MDMTTGFVVDFAVIMEGFFLMGDLVQLCPAITLSYRPHRDDRLHESSI
jgi:hypothetical protein